MKSFSVIFILILSTICPARSYGQITYKMPMDGDSKHLQKLQIPQDYIDYVNNRTHYTEIIPADLQPTQSEAAVFNRFADRGVQIILSSEQMKATPLGRTADTVQNTLKTDFEAESAEIKHHFSFQILALQSAAQFKYSGWLDAIANIDLGGQRSELEFSNQLSRLRTIFLNYNTNPDYSSTLAGMRVKF